MTGFVPQHASRACAPVRTRTIPMWLQADFANLCPAWWLHWNYRKRNLLREMLAYKADILCLQEVWLFNA